MASNNSFVYYRLFDNWMKGTSTDFSTTTGAHRMSVGLLMTATTADDVATNPTNGDPLGAVGNEIEFLNEFDDLDEFDGSGYSRQTLGSLAVTFPPSTDSGVFDAGNATFTAISGGSTAIAAVFLYYEVGADASTPADDRPVAYFGIDPDFAANGGDVIVNWNAAGIISIANA